MEINNSVDEMISGLMNGFRKDNVVLYVGRKGKREMTPELCALPWSCVVTSCTDGQFGTEFAETKQPHRYTKREELPTQIFNKNELPVIQIYGNEGMTDVNLKEYEDELMKQLYLEEEAKRILSHIMVRMDIRSRLVIVGYDSTDPSELPMRQFILSWREMKGGHVELYGAGEETEFLGREILKRNGILSTELLSEALLRRQKLDDEHEELEHDTQNIFYKGRMPVAISKSILLRSRNFIQLLTEESIYEKRPLGRIEQAKWFYNFLNNSSETPQWYGYLPQSEFYLKRNYEEILVELVQNLISGKNMKREENRPIILQGDPGSSKSIEMGALAYRIYQEKKNPVIYIKNDNLSFNEQSSELEQLDELMQEVENVGEKDTRFLVIWDSSSYRKVVENAKNLTRCLENRGRRFVLVCTAYSKSSGEEYDYSSFREKIINNLKAEWYYFKPKESIFVRSNTEKGDVYCDGSCYFLKAERKMSDQEIVQLKQNAKLYSLASQEELNRIWKKLENETDIFTYFYYLMGALRPKLENNLTREQKLVNSYVNQQLAEIRTDEKIEEVSHTLVEALLKAGIVLEESDKELLEKEENLSEVYDLNRFNVCIAIFSRFKLDTPYSLALRMLCKDEDEFYKKNISYNNYELFKVLTNQIPYIHYCEAEEGSFVFRYRNILEAELFLERNAIEPEQQIDQICSALDYYAECYHKLGEVDEKIKNVMARILRMIGPNTDYVDFQIQGKGKVEHEQFMKYMEKIIIRLNNLRVQDKIPDTDASFANIEITFIREYYGKLWDILNKYNRMTAGTVKKWEAYPLIYTDKSYVRRLKQLKNASDLSLENIDKLQKSVLNTDNSYARKFLVDQINSLSVEACLCNRSLEEIWEEYQEFCEAKRKEISISYTGVRPLSYKHQYEMLVKATITSPLNGYAYNALFNAFEKEYKKSGEAKKLQLLSEVRMIADDASTLPIMNRGMNGKDELTDHISRIVQYSCKHKVTIEDIESGDKQNPFYELFQEMLDQNIASAICFICQQELDNIGLGANEIAEKKQNENEEYVLDKKQLEVCEKVMNFMIQDEYELCICNNPYALYLLIRVEWMLFNGRPLFSGKEKQLTYLSLSNWREINRVCELYESCAGASPRPIVTLLYALSELQLRRDYRKASSMMSKLSETAFYSTPRMRVPYLICFEPGVPELYTGTVLSIKNYSGFIKFDGLPERLGSNVGVRFQMKNLGLRKMPNPNLVLKNLELGLGYTGFSSYRKVDVGGEVQ